MNSMSKNRRLYLYIRAQIYVFLPFHYCTLVKATVTSHPEQRSSRTTDFPVSAFQPFIVSQGIARTPFKKCRSDHVHVLFTTFSRLPIAFKIKRKLLSVVYEAFSTRSMVTSPASSPFTQNLTLVHSWVPTSAVKLSLITCDSMWLNKF